MSPWRKTNKAIYWPDAEKINIEAELDRRLVKKYDVLPDRDLGFCHPDDLQGIKAWREEVESIRKEIVDERRRRMEML